MIYLYMLDHVQGPVTILNQFHTKVPGQEHSSHYLSHFGTIIEHFEPFNNHDNHSGSILLLSFSPTNM